MRSRFRLIAFLYLGVLLTIAAAPLQSARADELWRYVEVNCRPAEQKATITLRYLWNERPTLGFHGQIRPGADADAPQDFNVTDQIDYGECRLAPGIPLRVKGLEGLAMPYGMCGADPEFYISVWVNQRKWLSRRFIDGRCPDTLVTRIDITPAGLTTCFAAELSAKEECEFTPAAALATEPDLAEYPIGPRGPLPGTIVTDFAEDPLLCDSMIHKGQTETGLQDWNLKVPPEATSWLFLDRPYDEWNYNKSISRQVFDIDNSGAARIVYGYHPDNHTNDADIYFASPGSDFDDPWPGIAGDAYQRLYQQSPYIFPLTVGTCRGHPCGPADDPEEGELTLQHPSGDGTPVTFRFRYWHQTPFTWTGTTYFMAHVYDIDQRHLTIVLKPKPTGFGEVCLFRKVLDNY
jgi:hypothetical protein